MSSGSTLRTVLRTTLRRRLVPLLTTLGWTRQPIKTPSTDILRIAQLYQQAEANRAVAPANLYRVVVNAIGLAADVKAVDALVARADNPLRRFAADHPLPGMQDEVT